MATRKVFRVLVHCIEVRELEVAAEWGSEAMRAAEKLADEGKGRQVDRALCVAVRGDIVVEVPEP